MLTIKNTNLLYISILLIIWVLLCFFINPILNTPVTDDWRYAYPVKSLIETEHLTIKSIFAPNILFQIVWGYLFCLIGGGFSFTALRFSTLVIAFIGILFFYKIIKESTSSNLIAFLFCLLVIFNPFFLSLSYSFMTDVPFLSLCIIALYSFQLFLKTEKNQYLAWGILFSIAAFLVRQPGIIMPFILAIILSFRKNPGKKYWILATILILISFFTYFATEWLKIYLNIKWVYVNVTDQYIQTLIKTPQYFVIEILKKSYKAIITIGLLTLPVFPLIKNALKYKRNIHLLIILLNLVILIFMVNSNKIFPFDGTTIKKYGIGPVLLKDISILELPNAPEIPKFILILLNYIGQLAGSYMFIALYLNLKEKITPFKILLVFFTLIYLGLMAITSFFDRYYLLPVVAALILMSEIIETNNIQKWRKLISFTLFIPIFWFSLAGTKEYMAWRKAQLTAFNWITNQGITIKEMDAGMELNGWYNYSIDLHPPKEKSWWWVNDDKYVLSMGNIKGYTTIKRFPYFRYLSFKEDYIYVLKQDADKLINNYKLK